MPATVPTRGVLKASTNRVRTSTALQGNAMWENVIGITNEQAGTNTGVEALINAPTIGGGRKASQARRQAAAEAVLATGGFDTSITNYQSLLAMAKQQGAVGTGNRGACKSCGQMGHLTKQCRNFPSAAAGEGGSGGGAEGGLAEAAAAQLVAPPAADDSDSLGLSDSSDEERRRKKRRKEKRSKHSKSSKERRHKSKKSKKEKKEKKDKKSKHKKRRRHSSSSSSSSSGSDSD